MRHKTPHWVALAAFLVAGSLGCLATETSPTPAVPIQELLLDASSLPPDWAPASPGPAPQKLGQTDSFWLEFHAPSVFQVNEIIFSFPSITRATMVYDDENAGHFRSPGLPILWTTPANFHYQSSVATQYRFACKPNASILSDTTVRDPICVYIGQFNQYLFELTVYATDTRMQTIDFEKIVRAIDDRMKRVK